MGQEAGKPSWPKPAGGYQTITGRRYGRRHAYVNFRPTPYKHKTLSNMDCQEVEMNNVHKAHSNALSKRKSSSVLPSLLSMPSSCLLQPESKANQDYNKHSLSSHKLLECEKWKGDCRVTFNPEHNTGSEKSASAWAAKDKMAWKPHTVGVPSFVNIDSYEPDSSGGEEEGFSSHHSPAILKRLDRICDFAKGIDNFSHSHGTVHANFGRLSDCSAQEMPFEPDQEDINSQKNGKTIGNHSLLGKVQTNFDNKLSNSGGSCCFVESDGTNMQETVQSEMVVRPKVKKQTSESHLDKKYSQTQEAAWISKSDSAPPFILPHTTRTDFLCDFPSDVCTTEKTEQALQPSKVKISENKDDDFWEDLEDYENCGTPEKESESSEYSEGEWSASWMSDSGLEKERCSSEESWETLPGLDELPASSSSLEDIPLLNFTREEQIPLEEGEIPWCNEDSGSSSDENPESMSQFVHPGLFIMDSSNNLEDDSSLSEDLDIEWRLLDDFEEGLGMAQVISYMDHPQLLTYMALEERLAQAMEAALAHLESLAIDVEQAHPPASEHMIDSLPHVVVQDDHRGQEQSCAICCCEYVGEEIATQLPCRHLFHKLCITLWLRKSGTCPVCRHVLNPPQSEPTPFLSNQENPSLNPSAGGQTQ